jgi:inward rectifier potassium channel
MNGVFEPSPLATHVDPSAEAARQSDLGFGSVVSRDSRRRLLNRDGSFNVMRAGLGVADSLAPYHRLLTMTWWQFFGFVGLVYLALNFGFGLLYMACGRDALLGAGAAMLGGRLSQAFFFSVQTFATIGYGQIAPNGLAANVVVTIEALVGLMYQALATGLLFARFARPTASIVFSDHAVVAPYGDGRGLMFRIANRRRNEIIQLDAQVLYSALESDGGSGRVRRYTPLPLERNHVTFFPLSWTIVHPIDSASPLAGKSHEDLLAAEAEILILLSGIDETFEQTVHARTSYRPDEIVWGARFRSVFRMDGREQLAVDIRQLHEIERVSPP